MSSRAVRKLQRDKDFSIGLSGLDNNDVTTDVQTKILPLGDQSGSDVDSDNENDVMPVRSSAKNKKKKKATGRVIPGNPFSLLNEDSTNLGLEEEEEQEREKSEIGGNGQDSALTTAASSIPKKSKKPKKKNKNKEAKLEMADSEKCGDLSELSEMLNEDVPRQGPLTASNQRTAGSDASNKPILGVEHRCLDPDNEIRRIFGTVAVQQEHGRRRQQQQRNHPHHRNTWLVNPRDNWPPSRKTGLSMEHIETRNGLQYYRFVHSKAYQKVQFQFLDAVESLNPQNLVDLLNINPFHIDTLLQVSDIFKMNEDWRTASQMVERALHVFESSFHATFSLTLGTCRLDYRYPENRSFYLALLHHLLFVGRRGCYRTALEFCKLILSFDPDNDPLCILLLIDFYSIRSEQYTFLERLASEWEAQRCLSQLPNFAFSVPLALFHRATADGTSLIEADQLLQQSLLMFPSLLKPLLDKCSVASDSRVASHSFFGISSEKNQPDGLTRLIQLYVGRSHFCWKESGVLPWLERNVRTVLDRVDNGEPVDKYLQKRASRYQGMPRNIYRHIVLSDIKEAAHRLPPLVTGSAVLGYDPLPPDNSIVSYKRPQRPSRAQEASNPLTMFLRTLDPSYDPQEPVREGDDAGAVGGQPREGTEVRQNINAVMTAMRAMFNRIQFVPPPVENPQNNGDEPDEGIDEFLEDDAHDGNR